MQRDCRCRAAIPNRRQVWISWRRAPDGEPVILGPGERALIPTGFAMELPPGFEGQIRPRSGLALKHGVTVLNAPGTIDADYRGEIGVLLINLRRQTVRGDARRADRSIGREPRRRRRLPKPSNCRELPAAKRDLAPQDGQVAQIKENDNESAVSSQHARHRRGRRHRDAFALRRRSPPRRSPRVIVCRRVIWRRCCRVSSTPRS